MIHRSHIDWHLTRLYKLYGLFSRERNVVWKKCFMKCGVWNQMKRWFSHLLDNLSNCLMNLKNSGDSTGFEPMTSAMPVPMQLIWRGKSIITVIAPERSKCGNLNTKKKRRKNKLLSSWINAMVGCWLVFWSNWHEARLFSPGNSQNYLYKIVWCYWSSQNQNKPYWPRRTKN